ncbi:hypothetical protein [Chitinimonas sp. BJB300]|uniref:hypothetical protein n=1 Tax=Chitinimonas sp. BJB300 TaxID=1559339 RepID=UPI0011121472|nr:hypothetical protein [Chitinimonas sp. BJB300]TSJ82538.1 hypothetical protein FG002_022165 [Chitinimonas sp. BJB300]TSJ83896.1 hypothetical protein FG002_020430 [Chitinimonas sp. BJB300]
MKIQEKFFPRCLGLFLLGIVIGSLVTCFLASLAVERRDAILMSTYHGLEGAHSLQAEQVGHRLDAYTHQANVVSIMEQKEKAIGLDLVPWSLITPFSSSAQTIIVPSPSNDWTEKELAIQKNRLMKLSK